jgi:DMSO/TMAO reductase YedYZ heme-binding membrane subunit
MLVPLAVTSTKGWVRRLGGKRWQRLHRLVYVATGAGLVQANANHVRSMSERLRARWGGQHAPRNGLEVLNAFSSLAIGTA